MHVHVWCTFYARQCTLHVHVCSDFTHIKVFIVLKHPSKFPSFDDLSNFVNAVTVNGVTHCVVTTLTNMTFSFTCWKHES